MTHMPGAVIDLVLSDPRYGVEPAVGLSQLPAASCVTVYRNRFNIAGGGLQAIICFNKQTSMPERATVMLANLARQGATVPEKIQYKEFQQMGAILVPKLVEVTNPVGVHTLYSITSIHTAPAAGGHQ